jgi:hypothetical protein
MAAGRTFTYQLSNDRSIEKWFCVWKYVCMYMAAGKRLHDKLRNDWMMGKCMYVYGSWLVYTLLLLKYNRYQKCCVCKLYKSNYAGQNAFAALRLRPMQFSDLLAANWPQNRQASSSICRYVAIPRMSWDATSYIRGHFILFCPVFERLCFFPAWNLAFGKLQRNLGTFGPSSIVFILVSLSIKKDLCPFWIHHASYLWYTADLSVAMKSI